VCIFALMAKLMKCVDDIRPKPLIVCEKAGDDEMSCCICMEAKCNAAFLHGNTMHLAACYACASEYSTERGCPVCMQKGWRLVKVHN